MLTMPSFEKSLIVEQFRRNYLSSSFLHCFAGGNSRETVRHFVPHVRSSMHVLCVAHVWSVQRLLLNKYANLLEGAKHELAFGAQKNIKLHFRSQPKKSLEEALLICIQLLTNFQNTLGKKIDENDYG